jgi:V/A-type H+-transporting ATPase subunit E
MKGLESGKDKVRKICEVLKKETLQPAQREAEEIILAANETAQRIISDAKKSAEVILSEGNESLERQKNVFQSSLNQACKQVIESLKQEIESKMLDQELLALISKQMNDPSVIAEIINAVVSCISKEGLDTDMTAYVAESTSARNINTLLAQNMISKLREKEVVLSQIHGGVAVKLHNQNITIDITDKAVKDLVSQFISKRFS